MHLEELYIRSKVKNATHTHTHTHTQKRTASCDTHRCRDCVSSVFSQLLNGVVTSGDDNPTEPRHVHLTLCTDVCHSHWGQEEEEEPNLSKQTQSVSSRGLKAEGDGGAVCISQWLIAVVSCSRRKSMR